VTIAPDESPRSECPALEGHRPQRNRDICRLAVAFARRRAVQFAGSALSLLVIRAKSWSSTSMCSTTGSTSTVPFA